jgi:hypothetical protein
MAKRKKAVKKKAVKRTKLPKTHTQKAIHHIQRTQRLFHGVGLFLLVLLFALIILVTYDGQDLAGQAIEELPVTICYDTDFGRNINEQGKTRTGETVFIDECMSVQIARKYYCVNNEYMAYTDIECSGPCNEGMCV